MDFSKKHEVAHPEQMDVKRPMETERHAEIKPTEKAVQLYSNIMSPPKLESARRHHIEPNDTKGRPERSPETGTVLREQPAFGSKLQDFDKINDLQKKINSLNIKIRDEKDPVRKKQLEKEQALLKKEKEKLLSFLGTEIEKKIKSITDEKKPETKKLLEWELTQLQGAHEKLQQDFSISGAEAEKKLNRNEVSFGSFVVLCSRYCDAKRVPYKHIGTSP